MKYWPAGSHEGRVEQFYSTGIDGRAEPHGFNDDLLNFGLGSRDLPYVRRAKNLIHHLAKTYLDLGVDDALLDVGCGMGRQPEILVSGYMPKIYRGIDVTRKHVELCKRRFSRFSRETGHTDVEFKHASAVAIPYPEATFTKVLSIEAVEHCNTRLSFCREAYRVLRPGGVLACADFILLRDPQSAIERWLVRNGARIWCVPQANIYDYRTLRSLLESTGFIRISMEFLGAQTIPGYFWGHRKFSVMREVRKVRGFLKGVLGGFVIDYAVYWLYRRGLMEYVVYRAEKPGINLH